MDFVEIERWTKEMRFIFWIAELHLGLIILEFLSLFYTSVLRMWNLFLWNALQRIGAQ